MNPPRPPPPAPAFAGSAFFLVDMPPSLIEIVSPTLSEKSCDGCAVVEEELVEDEDDEEGASGTSFGGFCRFDQSVCANRSTARHSLAHNVQRRSRAEVWLHVPCGGTQVKEKSAQVDLPFESVDTTHLQRHVKVKALCPFGETHPDIGLLTARRIDDGQDKITRRVEDGFATAVRVRLGRFVRGLSEELAYKRQLTFRRSRRFG